MKVAVILFNLGGPDSKQSIEPFLMNFFTDKNIVRLPNPMRWFIARMIAYSRSRKEAAESYHELGDQSPLLANSTEQVRALEENLNAAQDGKDYKVFICMRYWHPMAPEVARNVKDWEPDHIVLLPLYPQFSTTTTRSSYQQWEAACDDIDLLAPVSTICCYPRDNGFIAASADNVRQTYDRAFSEFGQAPRVLFSAHGVPEDFITDGDPYQWQVEQSAADIAAATGIHNLDWQVCYQSRVGRKKWIGPSIDESLHKAAAEKIPVIVLPHAFTQEHVETLVEIEIEYRLVADKLGIPGYMRVPVVGTHPAFIDGLGEIVRREGYRTWLAPDTGKRICPQEFCRCLMQ